MAIYNAQEPYLWSDALPKEERTGSSWNVEVNIHTLYKYAGSRVITQASPPVWSGMRFRIGRIWGNITGHQYQVQVWTVSGTTMDVMEAQGIVVGSVLNGIGEGGYADVMFATPFQPAATTEYYIVVTHNGAYDNVNYIELRHTSEYPAIRGYYPSGTLTYSYGWLIIDSSQNEYNSATNTIIDQGIIADGPVTLACEGSVSTTVTYIQSPLKLAKTAGDWVSASPGTLDTNNSHYASDLSAKLGIRATTGTGGASLMGMRFHVNSVIGNVSNHTYYVQIWTRSGNNLDTLVGQGQVDGSVIQSGGAGYYYVPYYSPPVNLSPSTAYAFVLTHEAPHDGTNYLRISATSAAGTFEPTGRLTNTGGYTNWYPNGTYYWSYPYMYVYDFTWEFGVGVDSDGSVTVLPELNPGLVYAGTPGEWAESQPDSYGGTQNVARTSSDAWIGSRFTAVGNTEILGIYWNPYYSINNITGFTYYFELYSLSGDNLGTSLAQGTLSGAGELHDDVLYDDGWGEYFPCTQHLVEFDTPYTIQQGVEYAVTMSRNGSYTSNPYIRVLFATGATSYIPAGTITPTIGRCNWSNAKVSTYQNAGQMYDLNLYSSTPGTYIDSSTNVDAVTSVWKLRTASISATGSVEASWHDYYPRPVQLQPWIDPYPQANNNETLLWAADQSYIGSTFTVDAGAAIIPVHGIEMFARWISGDVSFKTFQVQIWDMTGNNLNTKLREGTIKGSVIQDAGTGVHHSVYFKDGTGAIDPWTPTASVEYAMVVTEPSGPDTVNNIDLSRAFNPGGVPAPVYLPAGRATPVWSLYEANASGVMTQGETNQIVRVALLEEIGARIEAHGSLTGDPYVSPIVMTYLNIWSWTPQPIATDRFTGTDSDHVYIGNRGQIENPAVPQTLIGFRVYISRTIGDITGKTLNAKVWGVSGGDLASLRAEGSITGAWVEIHKPGWFDIYFDEEIEFLSNDVVGFTLDLDDSWDASNYIYFGYNSPTDYDDPINKYDNWSMNAWDSGGNEYVSNTNGVLSIDLLESLGGVALAGEGSVVTVHAVSENFVDRTALVEASGGVSATYTVLQSINRTALFIVNASVVAFPQIAAFQRVADIVAATGLTVDFNMVHGYGIVEVQVQGTLVVEGNKIFGGLADFIVSADLVVEDPNFLYSFIEQHYLSEMLLVVDGEKIIAGNFTVDSEGSIDASSRRYGPAGADFSVSGILTADGNYVLAPRFMNLMGRGVMRGTARGIGGR